MGCNISRITLGLVVFATLLGCRQATEPEPSPAPPALQSDVDHREEVPPEPAAAPDPREVGETVAALETADDGNRPTTADPTPADGVKPAEAAVENGSPLYPLSIAAGPAGDLYLADHHLPGIWRVQEGRLSLFFQGEKTFRTPLNAIRCVAFDAQGRLLAGDSATGDVYRFDSDGQPRSLTARDRPLGQITIPVDIVVDGDGNLLVSDMGDHRIVGIPGEGGSVEVLAEVPVPRGLFFDGEQRLWVVSGRRLIRLTPDGEQETVVDNGVFEFPHAVVVRDDGVAYVSDGYAKTIWRIAPGREPEAWVSGPPLDNPVGMTVWQDRLLVADPRARAIFAIDPTGDLSKLEFEPAAP